jgi:hypothetical protein
MAGLRDTVSPIINPFVLATDRFRGLVTEDKDMFEADPCVIVTPLGTE